MLLHYWLIVFILSVVAFVSVKAAKLTVAAAITGWVAGFLIFEGAGFTGVTMIATFFILGTAATSWKMNVKQQLGLAEKDKGKRTAGQVIANAGVAAILGLLIIVFGEKTGWLRVMMAASLASATADTLSSEMGNVYGSRFYNILTCKKDLRGLDGVISLEGTCIGIFGSVIIAIIYAAGFGFDITFLFIIIAGTLGNLFDSVLGASAERKKYLGNNAVNFLNTLFAATIAALFYWCRLK